MRQNKIMRIAIVFLAVVIPVLAQTDAREKREMDLQEKIAANPVDIASLTEFSLMKLADLREVPDRMAIEAEPMTARLLAIREQDASVPRSDLALALEMEAKALEVSGRAAEAAPLAARALVIRKDIVHGMAAPAPEGQQVERVRPPAISAPSVLFKIDPQYSEPARVAKVSGTVLVSVIVDSDGLARDINVARGLGFGLDEQAAQALAQWRFKPGLMNGQPTPVRAQIEINFRLL